MNTNSNAYTVIYTTLVVVVVAAVLAFTAMKLKPSQEANAKAETLRQMMSAAQIKATDELYATNNAGILQLYAENIEKAYTIGLDGQENGTLSIDKANIELVDNLKPQNKAIKAGGEAVLPVYVFKNGYTVIPVYGAGLWGPIWGYVAFQADRATIAGAYFDHESETPGLGAKIKDEAWFREKFVGKTVAFGAETLFNLGKNAEETGAANAVDAISGATMTSKGLNDALNVWFKAYESHLANGAACCQDGEHDCEHCENHKAEEE